MLLDGLWKRLTREHERDALAPLPFPPPYRRMIAINSDVEFTTWPAQVDLIRLFADLGLETSFSYWFFNDPAVTWRLFEDDLTLSPQATAAFVLARAGVLDTIHSFGGTLNGRGCYFDRAKIEKGYAILKQQGIETRIYSNHGTVRDTQNIGGPWMAPATPEPRYDNYHEGDLPTSGRYHLDLTLEYGVRFFWVDVDRVRQRASFAAGQSGAEEELFLSQVSRDGNPILRFRRTDTGVDPDAVNLGAQIRNVMAADAGRYSIIYTHLGVARDAKGKPVNNTSPYLSRDGSEALTDLKRSFESGETLVTSTEKLLAHALLMAARPWTIAMIGKSCEVVFERSFQYAGMRFELAWKDLRGFAFHVPRGTGRVVARLGSSIREFERWEADGRQLAGFAWQRTDLGQVLDEALTYVR